jgi:hypothetical protein
MLRPGDVIFTSEKTLKSGAIRKVSKGESSHVLLCVGHGSCIHADKKGGVHSFNIQRLLISDPANVSVRRLSGEYAFDKVKVKCVTDYARSKIGTKYSCWEAVKSLPIFKADFFKNFSIDLHKPSSLQFCSRLVAESYKNAGIKLVDNPSSCTPADLEGFPGFRILQDVFVLASKEDISFALDVARDKIKKQTDITSKLLSSVRERYGSHIQTLNDVLQTAVDVDGADAVIADITEKSGYLYMWRDDLEACPWRYQSEIFRSIKMPNGERQSTIMRELKMARTDIERFTESLERAQKRLLEYPLVTLEQQVTLYTTLLRLAHQRQSVFLYLETQ